jgi:hypothetical protein
VRDRDRPRVTVAGSAQLGLPVGFVCSNGGLMAGRQLATGRLDQSFPWLSSVLQKMLNW